ncbi:MAG: gluconate 2-dehydrogenase subunit 3 family protein [Cyanobacteria bacterium J06639_1]
MAPQFYAKGDRYVLNFCAKHLARELNEPRHHYNHPYAEDEKRSRILEPWRFPIVDSYNSSGDSNADDSNSGDAAANYDWNEVTFVYDARDREPMPSSISVVGTFGNLYEPIPLQPVHFLGDETGYFSITTVVPKGEVHTYHFWVDGAFELDSINPQRAILDNGKARSRFFTQFCTERITFERWEAAILERLTETILPFRTADGENFLNRYYHHLGRDLKAAQFRHAHRIDRSIGAVNFIDKLLAREESHYLGDYRICLDECDRLLRQRNPFREPNVMSREMYVELHQEMADGAVNGWDTARYANPNFFLQLVRRHAYTGAFSHPKYGGNAGAAGWAYLAERSPFAWRNAIESPLGVSADYRG